MFGAEVASAFVRIRPNLTGFKSETQSGVKSAFSGIGKIVGVALGAGAAFEFGKSVVEDAAAVQKSVEGIRAEFGSASKSLLDFADNGGVALGSLNATTDATSVKLGTLFRNMGIGQQAAATMTANWEKLALAFNATSGGGTGGAATLLQQLQSAATSGSARSLRNLGLSFNTAQIQVAAFKLGLTQTITQALLPSQRAIAVYSLAMTRLPALLAQAKAHASDFANVQARLSAEWNQAKEAIGQALLPEITRLATEFSNWLDRMVKSGQLQRDFNSIAQTTGEVLSAIVDTLKIGISIWNTFAHAVGGTKNAIELLIALKMTSTFAGWGRSIASMIGGAGAGAGAGKGLTGAAAAATNLRSALLKLQGLAIVATVEVIFLESIKNKLAGFQKQSETAAANAPQYGDLYKHVAKQLIALEKELPTREAIQRIYDQYGGRGAGQEKLVAEALQYIATLHGQKATGYLKQYLEEQARKIAAQSKSVLDLTQKLSAKMDDVMKRTNAALRATIENARTAIESSVRSAKDNLDKIGQDLAKTIDQIQAKIGGAAGALAGSPQGQAFAKLKKLIESGVPSFEIARARNELSSQLQNVGKTQATALQTKLANLTNAFNKGQISTGTFDKRLQELLRASGGTYANALKAGGSAFADQLRAEISALKKQAQAISDVPAKYRGLGGGGGAADLKIIRPLQVIRSENLKIATAAAKQRAEQLKAQQKSAALLQAIHSTQIASTPLPGYGKHRHGKGSHDARKAAKIGLNG